MIDRKEFDVSETSTALKDPPTSANLIVIDWYTRSSDEAPVFETKNQQSSVFGLCEVQKEWTVYFLMPQPWGTDNSYPTLFCAYDNKWSTTESSLTQNISFPSSLHVSIEAYIAIKDMNPKECFSLSRIMCSATGVTSTTRLEMTSATSLRWMPLTDWLTGHYYWSFLFQISSSRRDPLCPLSTPWVSLISQWSSERLLMFYVSTQRARRRLNSVLARQACSSFALPWRFPVDEVDEVDMGALLLHTKICCYVISLDIFHSSF